MKNTMILHKEESTDFIRCYESFYYDCTDIETRKKLGIPLLKTTAIEIENYIVTEKLEKGLYDIDTFAWKNGMIKELKNNQVIYADGFSKALYVNCRKGIVKKKI